MMFSITEARKRLYEICRATLRGEEITLYMRGEEEMISLVKTSELEDLRRLREKTESDGSW